MLAFNEQKVLLLTPPHTASRRLHFTLGTQGAIWINGPNPDGIIDHHTNAVAPEFATWKKVVVVRNPFARLVGLWFHLVDWCSFNGHGTCDFSQFVEMVANDDATKLSWMYRFTIRRWLGKANPDDVVRVESLADDVSKLLGRPVVFEGPVTRQRKPWREYYTEKTLSLAESWGAEDFARWYPHGIR